MGLGKVFFDDFFKGPTTDDRIRQLNAWALTHKGKPSPQVMLDAVEYNTTVPIGLASGLSLRAGDGSPAREFGRRTIVRYSGPSGTSLFRFGVPQTNQSYPSDNSPRDINVGGIEFRGGPSHDFIEPHPPGTDYRGNVLWMSEFNGCGWNGWRSIYWGAGDGISFDGVTHCQAFSDTAFWIGGSECSLFGRDAFSFMDSHAAGILTGGKPMIRSSMSKSTIGHVMVTTRQNILALLIDGGTGTRALGFTADSQDSDPANGANIRITGGKGHTIGDGTLKGHMADPTNGPGGSTLNRAAIHVEGGSDLAIDRETFIRQGPRAAPIDTALVYAGPNVGPAEIVVGITPHPGYSGTLLESKPGQILSIDPRLQVKPAP